MGWRVANCMEGQLSGCFNCWQGCNHCRPRHHSSASFNGHTTQAIDQASKLTIHNSVASDIAGINQALVDSANTLNGSGEVIAISDTGLDADHGDFDGRVRAVYNQFGPDNSALDSNSGHGTHVAATLLGDGSGDVSALGMVPAATFHFYQLEVDSSGILARRGSLYDMFSHAWQNSARIQTNSWGNENLVGEYSTDSRSTWFRQKRPHHWCFHNRFNGV